MPRKKPILPEENNEDIPKTKAVVKKSVKKPLIGEKSNKKKKSTKSNISYFTHSGHALTPNEAKFIDNYIESGNATKAVVEAGYTSKNPRGYGTQLLSKRHISEEIRYRLQKIDDEKIASATEVMQYFTSVMRGEILDQFGLEASLSERTRAAQELAKRKIDIPNKLNGKDTAEVKIVLDWSGMSDDETEENNGE